MNDDIVIRIEGHSELIRDPNTGAVINTAENEYQRFIEKRNKEKQQLEKIKSLEEQVDTLTAQFKSFEEMLKKLHQQ